MVQLAEEMKKKLEPKKVFSHRDEFGIIKGQNYGTCLMEEKTLENTLEFFRYQTGQKWSLGIYKIRKYKT